MELFGTSLSVTDPWPMVASTPYRECMPNAGRVTPSGDAYTPTWALEVPNWVPSKFAWAERGDPRPTAVAAAAPAAPTPTRWSSWRRLVSRRSVFSGPAAGGGRAAPRGPAAEGGRPVRRRRVAGRPGPHLFAGR